MIKRNRSICYRWYRWRNFWLGVRSIVSLSEAYDDLEGLAAWAKRKRLTKVHNHYRRIQVDVERQLTRYQFRYKLSFKVAKWTLYMKRQLIGERKYRKGYAARYKGM